MAKRLFLLLLSSLIGAILNPYSLMAENFVVFSPEFHAVETITVETEPENESELDTYAASTLESMVQYVRPTASTANSETLSLLQTPNYTVSFYVGSMSEYVGSALNLRYDGIYKFRKMIYGHNSANLLGSLNNRYVGEQFTITEGGIAKTYQVMNKVVYQKTADGYLDGNAKLMNSIVNSAMGYDVALLTCAGQAYGNGDASHRLVVFANAI